VNGSYKGDDAIGRMMHDFGCKDSKDIYYPELAKGVKHFKEEEGGRKIMCEAVEKYAKSYAEQYALRYVEEERSKTIKHMLGKGKTPEEISDFCGYDLQFVKKVRDSMAQTV
jgi:hypothetical protein